MKNRMIDRIIQQLKHEVEELPRILIEWGAVIAILIIILAPLFQPVVTN